MTTLKNRRETTLDLTGDLIEYRLNQIFDEHYLITVGGNLTGGITIQQDGADDLVDGISYKMRLSGGIVYTGGNVVTVFGRALSAKEALAATKIEATYDLPNATWIVDVQIDSANLLLDLTRGFIWIGDSTNTPVAVDAKGLAKLLVGDGTDLKSMEVDNITGQITATVAAGKVIFTIKNLGVVTAMLNDLAVTNGKIAPQAVTLDKIHATVQSLIAANGYLTFDVTIPAADVLASGGIPYEVIPNPGVGLVVDIIEASLDIVNAGVVTPYATSTSAVLKTNTANKSQCLASSALARTITGKIKMNNASAATIPTAAETVLVDNQAVYFTTSDGVNPTSTGAGDSDIRIQGTYQIKAV